MRKTDLHDRIWVPPHDLSEARRLLRQGEAPAIAAGIAAASQPLAHLTDDEGAFAAQPVFTLNFERFASRLHCAFPGLDHGIAASLWNLISRSSRLQLAYEVIFARALDPLIGLMTYPSDTVFSKTEREDIQTLLTGEQPAPVSGARPSAITGILKITRLCNLRCSYCHDWRTGKDATMPFSLRAKALHWLITKSAADVVHVILHGGEPTLIGPRGLIGLLALQALLMREGQQVHTRLQTNATRMSTEVIELLARFDIGVSVSLDGPPEVHDKTRQDARGRSSSDRVRGTIKALRNAGVLNGVLVVVTPALIASGPRRLVEFLAEEEITAVGLLPMRPAAGAMSDEDAALPVQEFCDFLVAVHRQRLAISPRMHVREIDAAIAAMHGRPAGTCELQGHCVGSYFGIEPDGAIMHCDKYVGDPRYVLGSVDDDFADVAKGVKATALTLGAVVQKHEKRECRWWSACRGWCPHESYLATSLGRPASSCCGLAQLFRGLELAERERSEAC